MKFNEKIQAIADTLPVITEMKGVRLTPQQVKQHFKRPKPGQAFYYESPVPVDHVAKLKKAHKKNGDQGITDYCAWVWEEHKKQKEQKPKEIKTL